MPRGWGRGVADEEVGSPLGRHSITSCLDDVLVRDRLELATIDGAGHQELRLAAVGPLSARRPPADQGATLL